MYTCNGVSMVGKVGAPQGMEGRLGEQQCKVSGESRCSLGNGGKFQGAMVFLTGRGGISQGVEESFEVVELGEMSWGIQRSLLGV